MASFISSEIKFFCIIYEEKFCFYCLMYAHVNTWALTDTHRVDNMGLNIILNLEQVLAYCWILSRWRGTRQDANECEELGF